MPLVFTSASSVRDDTDSFNVNVLQGLIRCLQNVLEYISRADEYSLVIKIKENKSGL